MESRADGLAENPADLVSQVRTTGADEWRAALRLTGDVDATVAPQLRAELDRHLDAGRRLIRIDLREVSFVDSVVLGELVRASQWCLREQGSLILTGVPARIARLISRGGLDSVLLINSVTQRSSDPG